MPATKRTQKALRQIPCPGISAYTMPLVIKSFEKCGLPVEIAKIECPKMRGPLLVTLAIELSVVVQMAITRSRTNGGLEEQIKDMRAKMGGIDYITLLNASASAVEHKTQVFHQIQDLEKHLMRLNYLEIVASLNRTKTKPSALGGQLFWCLDHSLENLQYMEDEYAALEQTYRLACATEDTLSAKFMAETERIESMPEFRKAKAILLEEDSSEVRKLGLNHLLSYSTRIELNNDLTYQKKGAAYYLRTTDPKWWQAFVQFVDKSVSNDMKTKILGFALRDAELGQRIRRNVMDPKNRTTFYGSIIEVLAKQNAEDSVYTWPLAKADLAGNIREKIGSAHQQMHKEDMKTMQWIYEYGGKHYPTNPYARWARQYPGRLAEAKVALAKKHRKYPIERATCELYWCLSRRDPVYAPFRGFYSLRFTVTHWSALVAHF